MEQTLNELIINNRAEVALMGLKIFGSFAALILTGWAYTHADWSKIHE
ncbi:hypothetical protein [Deinococcus sp. SL84]|nr:hypothetical protein [Deinococcus sp. SL84]MCY1703837.1 hypothetical protein [Deinococcus sp. SL84]